MEWKSRRDPTRVFDVRLIPRERVGTMAVEIIEAASRSHYRAAQSLFRDYARRLGSNLEFQGFERELADLPGAYAPPNGAILLARVADTYAGCVALRRLEDSVCEMKRLYVAPAARRMGIGRLLAEAIIRKATHLGYTRMRLDTLEAMNEARGLYASLGFQRIDPYCYNPLASPEFYERKLPRNNDGGTPMSAVEDAAEA